MSILSKRGRGRHAAAPFRGQAAPAPEPKVTTQAVRESLQARAALTAQHDTPTTVIPALRFTALDDPSLPLTEPHLLFDALGGAGKTARACGLCGTLQPCGEPSWRHDALCRWSCPACQAKPEWRSPLLPDVPSATRYTDPERFGTAEMGIIARSRLAADTRSITERPDGRFVAVLPVGGRRRVLGTFEHREDAQRVYGGVLDVFGSGTAYPASDWAAWMRVASEQPRERRRQREAGEAGAAEWARIADAEAQA